MVLLIECSIPPTIYDDQRNKQTFELFYLSVNSSKFLWLSICEYFLPVVQWSSMLWVLQALMIKHLNWYYQWLFVQGFPCTFERAHASQFGCTCHFPTNNLYVTPVVGEVSWRNMASKSLISWFSLCEFSKFGIKIMKDLIPRETFWYWSWISKTPPKGRPRYCWQRRRFPSGIFSNHLDHLQRLWCLNVGSSFITCDSRQLSEFFRSLYHNFGTRILPIFENIW